MVTERSTPSPVLVSRENAAALKSGRPVRMFCQIGAEPRTCVPLAVWKDKNRKVLAGVLGAAL